MLVLPIFMTIENDEERALAENLYLTYKSRMYSIAYAILHNREDAEDAVMDAVFGIVKNISLFSSIPRNKTESLIVVISRNAAINRYNYNKRRSTSSLDETANYIPDNDPTPEEMFGQKEDYEKLLADYNRLRDIKHDLYNYVHILDLAGDVRKEQEQIRQLQEDLKPGKQKEYIKYTNLSILNLVLNNVTSACEGVGIHPEVAAEEIQTDTNVELDMGYLIERMVHNVILLNEDQGENKQDSVSESLPRTLRIQIAPSESSDGNIQVVLKGIGLRMKGIEMNSDNRKEIRNNKQIIQFIMERHEGFQWNNRKESHLYLTA